MDVSLPYAHKRPDKIIAPDGTEIEIVYDAEPDAMTLSFQAAVDQAKADLRAKGLPVAILDENGKSCLEYADGRRKYRT